MLLNGCCLQFLISASMLPVGLFIFMLFFFLFNHFFTAVAAAITMISEAIEQHLFFSGCLSLSLCLCVHKQLEHSQQLAPRWLQTAAN